MGLGVDVEDCAGVVGHRVAGSFNVQSAAWFAAAGGGRRAAQPWRTRMTRRAPRCCAQWAVRMPTAGGVGVEGGREAAQGGVRWARRRAGAPPAFWQRPAHHCMRQQRRRAQQALHPRTRPRTAPPSPGPAPQMATTSPAPTSPSSQACHAVGRMSVSRTTCRGGGVGGGRAPSQVGAAEGA